jgi:uncharacterized protein YciI
MWYAIIAEDIPGTLAKRVEARPQHVERLKALQDAGRLLVAGPHPAIDSQDPGLRGFTGSLIIAEFATREAAIAYAGRRGSVLRRRCLRQGDRETLQESLPPVMHAV